jgi:hypothetical protein
LLATAAAAQIPPPTAPVSLPNPSSSLVLPAPGEVSVSPATRGAPLGSGFWYGYRFPPIGQDLRLTIVSTNDNDPTRKLGGDSDTAAEDRALDSIREMYATLRACWVPPPKDKARHGMQYTIRFALKRDGETIAPPRVTYASHDVPPEVRDVYREAVNATIARCTPLYLSKAMGDAVAGRPDRHPLRGRSDNRQCQRPPRWLAAVAAAVRPKEIGVPLKMRGALSLVPVRCAYDQRCE